MIKRIAAIAFIFICTSIAWMVLATTLTYRTNASDEQLQGRVGSTWGTPQEQSPPTAAYSKSEIVPTTIHENGKITVRDETVKRCINLPVESQPHPDESGAQLSAEGFAVVQHLCRGLRGQL